MPDPKPQRSPTPIFAGAGFLLLEAGLVGFDWRVAAAVGGGLLLLLATADALLRRPRP